MLTDLHVLMYIGKVFDSEPKLKHNSPVARLVAEKLFDAF